MQTTKKAGYLFDLVLLILTVVTFSFIPYKVNVLIKYAVLIYLLCKYIWYLPHHQTMLILLTGYSIVLSVSSYLNTASINWTISAFRAGVQLMVLFLVFTVLCQQLGKTVLIDYLIRLFLVLLLCNDLLFFVMPYDFSYPDESYLLGNKFLVSYYHCLFSCLVYIRTAGTKRRWIPPVLFVLCALVSLKVTCSTGIIMAGVLFAMMFIPKKLRTVLQKPATLLGAIAIENILIWGSANIFTNPTVQSIIVNVFHKSPNMTGRFRLYDITLSLVQDKPLLGYGHNTDIYRILFGYGNAQNGLMHIVVQAGIIGAVIYFCAVFCALCNNHKKRSDYGLYMYLFAMVVASAIEISLSLQFMLGLAILYSFNTDHWHKQTI